ncbi:urea ABC transporter permease subunit UrtC [Pusillimonas sp. CC-YST705]|uniref:Urea ABC transporter permease subunit UrtC n=1 Tax=Mesopusillimonas faecipullorum TaxID=2755040 RepID=A0ABS8CAX9_9BURK|nr:urea ABC transporter permease subunit UrtC [Mesopusillimonas faecipullorum]MCB5362784.1 urea ABC transporter permease subunit UrtC [Mesopusillimonas faecipullorum]
MGRYRDINEGLAYLLLGVFLVFILPAMLDPYQLSLFSKYISMAFVAIGIVLMWGYGGILSLGQGVFFGIGGYLIAMFLKMEASAPEIPEFMVWSSMQALPVWWVPFKSFTLTVIGVFLIPAVLAFVFSYAIFRKRISGVYLAIITLALALALSVWIIGSQGQTGGSNGITDFTTLLGMDILEDEAKEILYFVQLGLLLLVMLIASFIIRTRLGKILIAIRDHEDRVRFSGYNTALIKAFVFTVAAVLSSVGGAMYTLQVGLIAPSVVGVMASVEMVIYAAVGGRLSVPGAVVGALLIGYARSYLSENFPESWLFFLGAVFILVVVAMPKGLAGLAEQIMARTTSKESSL